VKKAVFVALVGLLFSFSYVAASASADTSGYLMVSYPDAPSYEPFTEPPSPTAAPDSCWDCEGSTMTDAEKLAAACNSEVLAAKPQMLDECFPEKWEWVCFPAPPDGNGTCEMYRRDLDPLGIFATPTPIPTTEPLPTPDPTATPDQTPVPDPEQPAPAVP